MGGDASVAHFEVIRWRGGVTIGGGIEGIM